MWHQEVINAGTHHHIIIAAQIIPPNMYECIYPQIAVRYNQVQVAGAWFSWLEVLPLLLTQPVPAVHCRMWMIVMTHQTASFGFEKMLIQCCQLHPFIILERNIEVI